MALIDFGSAENLRFTHDTYAHCQGSFEYRSPEQEFEGANKSFDDFKAVRIEYIFTWSDNVHYIHREIPDNGREEFIP